MSPLMLGDVDVVDAFYAFVETIRSYDAVAGMSLLGGVIAQVSAGNGMDALVLVLVLDFG